ncbi:hypothetical protein CHGG_04620 [Chaetomium globosum CBS 148.51]|uniref:rRNA-processing protein FYV7 n=1 Tax=Chaetomium globosum (strain ATCC 6205 / CBS 148.51 / DSM 1962 / NBRC 6347 / NRRL 1970) TaxID=306901 RepID=Q2H0S6_CHAGB|nr:uncharacterized protein CHGG_04620 [Chaetomium globosum CBS 148.51]EAQ88001.1 hypothetical protein CHGG_04620 [Chaetomium globosum CBS 148.51]
MPSKRPRDEDAAVAAVAPPTADDTRKLKKAKHGFRVGPENLPDGAWRRKVTKIKKDLITKAKVKKQYAKIKAEHQKQASAPTPEDHTKNNAEPTIHPDQEGEDSTEPAPAQIHPERQAMLDAPSSLSKPPAQRQQRQRQQQQHQPTDETEADPAQPHSQTDQPDNPRQKRKHRHHKPDYYTKELATAERAKQAAAERAAEAARREQERQRRVADRERYRRAMAKAKTPGRDGRVKIGRESRLLLERVQRVVGKS